MRSRISVAFLFALLLVAAPAPRAVAQAVTDAQMQESIEKVRADPSLAGSRKVKTLKQVDNRKPRENKKDGWLKDLSDWVGNLFSAISGSGRFIFWVVLATLIGVLLVYLWRLARSVGLPERSARVQVPSFVRDLDIRPESLPDDVGAAAKSLWDGGEHRAALALLYRGLLSRLAHVYRVPIKDSTTEGDCIALANGHLDDEERKLYVTSLVRVWQRAVYGGEDIPSETVHTLCDQFSRALDAPAAGAVPPGARAAGASA